MDVAAGAMVYLGQPKDEGLMSGRPLDVTGERYGRLVAIERAGRQGRNVCWKFKCDCGKEVVHQIANVRHGTTQSCGCYRDEKLVERVRTHGHRINRTTSRTLNQYNHAKNRCFSPRNKHYANFGGRGITMCDRWREGFQNFLDDMGECPDGLSLQRIDENGNFEPGNCEWRVSWNGGR